MAKLYPPYIDGTLPAFVQNGRIAVPFSINRATDKNSITGVMCKIKTAQNDALLTSEDGIPAKELKDNVAFFDTNDIDGNVLKIGQYYKIQIAFKSGSEIGYYSTVGVAKCTSMPSVEIEGMDVNKTNSNLKTFIGVFTQPEGGDVTEKVYSYKFVIKDSQNNEIFNTGELSHYASNDTESYTSTDQVNFYRDLDSSEIYNIQYIVTTTNNLVVESPRYYLTEQLGLNTEIKATLDLNYIYDEGAVEVNLKGFEETSLIDGMFVVLRSEDYNAQTKTGEWIEMNKFSVNQSNANRTIFVDYTVEQGKTYWYAIQQFNSYHVYSEKIISPSVEIDFDDIFLYDGKRQLKLKFNPQVSSFKTQLSESRQETIGNKYPFFFRNAAIGYKTFPISGLISMYLDDNETFIKNKKIQKEEFDYHRHDSPNNDKRKVYKHTDLLKENFTSERLFKLEVLDWLNDGNVKLFRSPAEGNYFIRIMDVSMTPNTTLGRMLHTVNCTAYECAEFTYDNLIGYNIIEEISEETLKDTTTYFGVKTYTRNSLIFTKDNGYYYSENLIKLKYGEDYVDNIKIEGLLPGTLLEIVPQGSSIGFGYEIMIGRTGNYYVDKIDPIIGIYIKLTESQYKNWANDYTSEFSFDVSYQYESVDKMTNDFNLVKSTSAEVGKVFNIVGENYKPILSSLNTSIRRLSKLCSASFLIRPIEYLYYNSDDKVDDDGIRIISPKDVKDLNIFEPFAQKMQNRAKGYYWYDWYSAYENKTDYAEYRTLKTYKNSQNENEKFKLDLFWLTPTLEKIPFSDERSKRHLPYALYILKEAKNDIPKDLFDLKENFIWSDQYLLTRYFEKNNPEEDILNLNSDDLVLDAWNGIIYHGENEQPWQYNPTVSFFNRIEREDDNNNITEDFEPLSSINLIKTKKQDIFDVSYDSKIDFNIGNGVYCYGFYQDVRSFYEFENSGYYADGYGGVWEDKAKQDAYNDLLNKKQYLGNAEYDTLFFAAEDEYARLVGNLLEENATRKEPTINDVPQHLIEGYED